MPIGHDAVDVVEERRLQRGRNRAAASRAHLNLVHGPDRRNLGRRAGEEHLVRDVQQLPRHVLFAHGQALILRERHDAVAGDARQHRRRQRRGIQDAVADDEEVLAAALAEEAVGIERDAFAVAVEHRLHLDQAGVGVVGDRLRHRRERVRRASA